MIPMEMLMDDESLNAPLPADVDVDPAPDCVVEYRADRPDPNSVPWQGVDNGPASRPLAPTTNDEPCAHECPARDRALNNRLMLGEDRDETASRNAIAITVLARLGHDIENEQTAQIYAWGNQEGDYANGDGPSDEKPSEELVLDGGPSPARLIKLYESGPLVWDEHTGEVSEHFKQNHKDKPLLCETKRLIKAGRLKFDGFGRITPYAGRCGRFVRYEDRLRGAHGRKARLPNPTDLELYTRGPRDGRLETQPDHLRCGNGGVFPREPEPAKLFWAGKPKCSPKAIGASDAAHQHMEREHREDSKARLSFLRAHVPVELMKAAEMAATGSTMKAIGEEAGFKGKQAEAVGLDRVRLAVLALAAAYSAWDAGDDRCAA